MSVAASLLFLASLAEFCWHLAFEWRTLDSQIRLDELFLAGLFLSLMAQLWRERSKTVWMPMVTVAVTFITATNLTHFLMPR